MSREGLRFGRTLINKVDDFPLIWDVPARPLQKNLLLYWGKPADFGAALRDGIALLCWPLASQCKTEIHYENRIRLSMAQARAACSTIQRLTADMMEDSPSLARKIRDHVIFRSAEEARKYIWLCDNLIVQLSYSTIKIIVPVKQWYDDQSIYLCSGSQWHRSLAEFCDFRFGTMFISAWNTVWEMNPVEETHRTAPAREKTTKNPLSEPTCETTSSQADRQPASRQMQLEDVQELSHADKEPAQRRRLMSLVTPGSTLDSSPDQGLAADRRNTEIEIQGAVMLKTFFQEQYGIELISRESEKVGYDFEANIGGKTILIELKSASDRWKGWEYALTHNEFEKAVELGEDYFICFIHGLRAGDPVMHFIRNPYSLVTDFLFDDPWQKVAVDINAVLAELKDQALPSEKEPSAETACPPPAPEATSEQTPPGETAVPEQTPQSPDSQISK